MRGPDKSRMRTYKYLQASYKNSHKNVTQMAMAAAGGQLMAARHWFHSNHETEHPLHQRWKTEGVTPKTPDEN